MALEKLKNLINDYQLSISYDTDLMTQSELIHVMTENDPSVGIFGRSLAEIEIDNSSSKVIFFNDEVEEFKEHMDFGSQYTEITFYNDLHSVVQLLTLKQMNKLT